MTNPNTVNITKEILENLYVNERKSSREISSILKVSQNTIMIKLKEFGIPRRSYKENKMPCQQWDSMPQHQRDAISKGLIGKSTINPKTGRGRRWSRVLIKCKICGKEVYKQQNHIKNHKNHYCSIECANKINGLNLTNNQPKPRVAKVCESCGKEFQVIETRVNKRKFCSSNCKYRFYAEIYGFDYPSWRKYSLNEYGSSWDFARKAARKRDKICKFCGITPKELGKQLDVHHIIPFRHFSKENHEKANNLSNLICYCNKCHTFVEQHFTQPILEKIYGLEKDKSFLNWFIAPAINNFSAQK